MLTIILISLFLVHLFIYFYKSNDKHIWEQIAVGLATLFGGFLLSSTIYYLAAYNGGYDTEYWGSYVATATHEEDWNEYIHKTCYKRYRCGTDSDGNPKYCTRSYDCSYVRYHPEKWWCRDNLGYIFNLDEATYLSYTAKWRNEYKSGHHNGYTNDGDIFTITYNNLEKDLVPLVTTHTYFNRIDISDSVFQFTPISVDKATKLGLFHYPTGGTYHPTVLGYTNSHELDVINATLGASKQIRIWVLVFKDKPESIALSQRDYWHNGNKNELVICIGLRENKVDWSYVFSWCENDEYLIRCREEIMSQKGNQFNLQQLASYLKETISIGWTRKQFADFDYLSIKSNGWVANTICIIILMLLGIAYPIWSLVEWMKNN